jgi:hypothetical protein
VVACDCVEACHGAEERMAVPLNWKGSLCFQLFLITFSTISVPSVATKSQGENICLQCSVPGISICSPCGFGLSTHGGGLSEVYVHGLDYDLVGLDG